MGVIPPALPHAVTLSHQCPHPDTGPSCLPPRFQGLTVPLGDQPCCCPHLVPLASSSPLKTSRLHTHPARPPADTAKDTGLIHERKKQTNQEPKPNETIQPQMNQRNANENTTAYRISKDKKKENYTQCGQSFETDTQCCWWGYKIVQQICGEPFSNKHQKPERRGFPAKTCT